MQFKTSTTFSQEQIKMIQQRLRQAAEETHHPEFFGSDEKLEIVNDPSFPPVEELAEIAAGLKTPEGDPTLCWLAYQAALRQCGGNSICHAVA